MQDRKPAPRPKRPAAVTVARPKADAPVARPAAPARTVLRAEHPVVARVQAPVQAPAHKVSGVAVAHYAMAALPALLAMFLMMGHDAMDRPDPRVDTARGMYLAAAIVGVVGLAGSAYLAVRNRWEAMLGAALGIPIAFWLVALARTFGGYYCGQPHLWTWGTTYPCDPDAQIGAELVGVVLLPLVGAGILAAVLHRSSPKAAQATFLGVAMALGAAFTIASALLIPTVGGDAGDAAKANQVVRHAIPGLEVALAAVALVGVAAWRRRRRVA